jgi:hypothetical protein
MAAPRIIDYVFLRNKSHCRPTGICDFGAKSGSAERFLPATRRRVKNKNPIQTNRGKFTVLRQVCRLIPPYLAPKVARETGGDEKGRTYSPWSHVVSQLG